MQEALQRAAEDSQLRSFLHEEATFNSRIQSSLRSIAVPENLQANILKKASAPASEDKIVVFPSWAKIAALVVLSGILLVSFFGPTPHEMDPLAEDFGVSAASMSAFIELESFATQFLRDKKLPSAQYQQVNSVEEIRNYLLSNNLPEPHRLVKPVEVAERFDCTALDYKGKKVSLINFAEKKSGIRCHLFIAALGEFPCLSENQAIEVREYVDSSAALWTCGQRLYLMIVEAPRDQLEIVMR